MTAFNDRAFGEIILHPPPLSYFSSVMVLFIFNRKGMEWISKCFSYFMFWFENIFGILAFVVFEIVICPIAYAKIWINIIRNSMGIINTIVNCIIWLFVGIFIMLFLLVRDLSYLIIILSYH